ncbi:oligosaccharide flippase family protein [Balneolales bacterium ANBcel1]|nr:oligosaccharide flippase family protein [Balneolales bacterium ANBcel1]
MGIILRQSFTNTIYSFIGAAIGFVNVIWLFPFVLEAGQFGLTRILVSISIIGTQVASLGMGNITLRFFPQFRDQGRQHHGFLLVAVTVPLIGFLLLSLAGWLFQSPIIRFYADDSALFGDYYFLLFPLLFFMLYFHILESYIRSLYDTVVATFFQDVLLRLLQTAAVLFYFFNLVSFGTFMWLFVLTYALQALLLLLYTGLQRQLYLKPDLRAFTRERIRSMGSYGAYALLGSVAAMALGNIDMIMVGGMTTLAETAVYAVSFYLATLIKIPSRNLLKISQPVIAEAHYNNDLDTISQIYRKSSINQLLVGGTLFLLIWANIDHIFRFLPDEYHAGIPVFLFIGLSKMIDMTSGFNAAIIRTSKWYRFDLYATVLLVLLTVITNLIFIPLYGITGAAMATVLSVFIHNATCFLYIRYRFGIQPFSRKTAGALLLLLLALAAATLLPAAGFWVLDFAIRTLVTTAFILFGIVLFRLSSDLEELIRAVHARIFKK